MRKQDARTMSFQQALPRLAQLSEDGEFVDAVNKVGMVLCGDLLLNGLNNCWSILDEGRTE